MVKLQQKITIFDELWSKIRLQVNKFTNINCENDYFPLFEVLLISGAIHYETPTPWKRYCWKLYRLLAAFGYWLVVARAVDNVLRGDDLLAIIWSVLLVLAKSVAIIKFSLLMNYFDTITFLRNFFNSNYATSGDEPYDSAMRVISARRIRRTLGAIIGIAYIDQVVLFVPSIHRQRLFGVPQAVYESENGIAIVARLAYTYSFSVIWVSRMLCATGTITALLAALSAELSILAHGYGNIMDRVHSAMRDEQRTIDSLNRAQESDLFWKHLKYEIRSTLEQHMQLLKIIQHLKPIVGTTFSIISLLAFVCTGSFIYICLLKDFSTGSLLVTSAVISYFTEFYWWCTLCDSFQDANQAIREHILDFSLKIPHTTRHHSDYIQMRTTLMMIHINSIHFAKFTCMGAFEISTEAFKKMINVAYSVMTFLLNMDKKKGNAVA